ncbi:type II secretion system protein GspJ [Tateyamaria sp. SN6-1]|uniref:type II secretion system protein GspJ n=1 Tax=Tateyamaria sp. SN6-1 TaxID=3092148 RepID=UPI0039F5DCC1
MTDRGLTLIELVLAMALFALVAVMGLQSLSGTLRVRDTLTERMDAAAALAQPVARLRNDLSALVPVVFFGPDDASPQSALWQSGDGARLALSLGGQVGIGRTGGVRPGDMHRVIWHLDAATGTLTRQRWDSLTPDSAAQRGPEVTVMTDVRALEVRSYWPRQGWQAGVVATQLTAASAIDDDRSAIASPFSDTLPYAVELTLVLADGREIPILETLQ